MISFLVKIYLLLNGGFSRFTEASFTKQFSNISYVYLSKPVTQKTDEENGRQRGIVNDGVVKNEQHRLLSSP